MREMQISKVSLSGNWQLQYGMQVKRARDMQEPEIPPCWMPIPATVPGNVELDLIRAGVIEGDLARGNNIYQLGKYENYQWWYTKRFDFGECERRKVNLVLLGVDTLATIWINGHKVGAIENMLVPHQFDVSEMLHPGENTIVIGIDSPILAGQEYRIEPCEWAMENNWEGLAIRKAAHTFGWDIMPRAVSAGLWRDIYLAEVPPDAFLDVYFATISVSAEDRTAEVWLKWDLSLSGWPAANHSVQVEIVSVADRNVVFSRKFPVLSTHACQRILLNNVELWWPRGYGPASLYDIKLTLLGAAMNPLSEWQGRVGFRKVELRRTETIDADGNGDFSFIVNGKRIFIKGTNWVPLDAFHSRDVEHLAETMDMLVDLNCNMVRCWGGSVYEDQTFFSRCDEEGILVWQDFALACALYPQKEEFFLKILKEAEAIIPLLRNHPSLALWAGNNEVDLFYVMNRPGSDPNTCDYISRVLLPQACNRMDPWREYLPSSPYFGPQLMKIGAPHDRRPEDHLWGPRNDYKGDFYKSSSARFVSEIGYHGCPARSTMEKMINPENLWPWENNQEWYTHAIRPQPDSDAFNYRIPLMANQVGYLFGNIPDELDAFIAASQISQAEANKHFIESYRIHKDVRSGILWWNLRDGWPQFSDAVVDYYGAKKLAYYVIRRVQKDVCVMLDEENGGYHEIIAVNDTSASKRITVKVFLNGSTSFESVAVLPENGKAALGRVASCKVPSFYRIEWFVDGEKYHNHYISGPRPYALEDCSDFYSRDVIGPDKFSRTLLPHIGFSSELEETPGRL